MLRCIRDEDISYETTIYEFDMSPGLRNSLRDNFILTSLQILNVDINQMRHSVGIGEGKIDSLLKLRCRLSRVLKPSKDELESIKQADFLSIMNIFLKNYKKIRPFMKPADYQFWLNILLSENRGNKVLKN